ncbi:MAG: triacylglycerol lipase [Lachnospiraceae bacterium]|nr:triacylglycerol lipase [Lachnospiraceae bacterium]
MIMNNTRSEKSLTGSRLNILGLGSALLVVFLTSVAILIVWLIMHLAADGIKATFAAHWPFILIATLIEIVLFWIGIIAVYLTSVQLGLKQRIIGIVCGLIPIANLVALVMIIRTTIREVIFEKAKLRTDKKRAAEQVCHTKYPLLMVHGVFFRDFKLLNYWGRIPAELEKNGATIYYGNHGSASAVIKSAEELSKRIKEIVNETGCEKVNVIAHSKGGLDIKTAVACLDAAPYVASITTINTPHLGCEFAEYLLDKAPEGFRRKVAGTYNAAFRKLGDTDPDFIEAVTDLTASKCRELTERISSYDFKKAGIYTQSVGSCMKKASGGQFPLNMSYYLVDYFDGKNDGLVGEPSFHWGEDYTYLENKKNRGISHGDMIDLNRENIPGFDVREFYVKLVEGLKKRGL